MGKQEKFLTLAKEHLNGEEIKYWVFGMFKSKMFGKDTIRNGIFIATERQIFFYCKKLTGFDSESFPFSNISSLEIGKGMLGHKMNIIASGNKVEMSGINTGQVQEFVEYARSKIGKPSESSSIQQSKDSTDEIRKFKALMDDGIISEDEFNVKKKQLLGI